MPRVRKDQVDAKGIPLSHYWNHTPKHPFCDICNASKSQNTPHRRASSHPDAPKIAADRPPEQQDDDEFDQDIPKKFGDLITADHVVLGDELEFSRQGDSSALISYDRASKDLDVWPAPRHNADHTIKGFQKFVGPQDDVKLVYTCLLYTSDAADDL